MWQFSRIVTDIILISLDHRHMENTTLLVGSASKCALDPALLATGSLTCQVAYTMTRPLLIGWWGWLCIPDDVVWHINWPQNLHLQMSNQWWYIHMYWCVCTAHVHTKDCGIYNSYIFHENVLAVVNPLIWFVFMNWPFPCSKSSQLFNCSN